MKKIIMILILCLISFLPAGAVSFEKDYIQARAVYDQYTKDIEQLMEDNLNVEEVKSAMKEDEESIEFIVTIKSDGSIRKMEQSSGWDIQPKDSNLYKILFKPVENGFKPFYPTMQAKEVQIRIMFSLGDFSFGVYEYDENSKSRKLIRRRVSPGVYYDDASYGRIGKFFNETFVPVVIGLPVMGAMNVYYSIQNKFEKLRLN